MGSAETMQQGSAVPVEQATSHSDERHINTLTEQIVGDWRSVYDEKEVFIFGADGSWMSSYDGNAPETGRWMLFAGDAPPPGLSHSFEPAENYLQVLREDWPPLVSEIGDVGPNDLELFSNQLAHSQHHLSWTLSAWRRQHHPIADVKQMTPV